MTKYLATSPLMSILNLYIIILISPLVNVFTI